MPIPLSTRIAAMIPTVTGWCSIEKGNDLALAVLKTKSAVSIDVGVWGGRSAIAMALAHAEQDYGVVWAIDPWSATASVEGYDQVNAEWWGKQDHELVYQNFLASLKQHGVEKYVKVIRARSDDAPVPDSLGVAHFDGQHTDQTVRDVERFASNVTPNGFVFCDDIHWAGGGVERGVEKLLTLGFVQIFTRDTGAMFQRQPAKTASAKKRAKKLLRSKGAMEQLMEGRRRGRPPGSKNKKRKKKSA